MEETRRIRTGKIKSITFNIMRILNLYAGIGGNRKLWGNEHDITAVELDPKIAEIYKDFFPNDNVIVGDAHKYLEEHFAEYDFIWSSPPCPSHSKIRNEAGIGRGQNKPIYPDMKLYEEIILMQQVSKVADLYKGKYAIENVISYYKPLVAPQTVGLHYIWSNYVIRPYKKETRNHFSTIEKLQHTKGFNLDKYQVDKVKLLRNCTEPETGLWVFNEAFKNNQTSIFQ